MSTRRTTASLPDHNRAMVASVTAAEVKTRLREQHGLTLKSWAKQNGYPYDTVSCVVRGINRATYGMGHRIAVALGMKAG